MGDLQWYPDFGSNLCKNDGQEETYMKRYDDYQFDTQAECCEVYFGHVLDNNCVNYTTPILELYFADYATGRCFQDCDPALDGCALVPPPVNVYPSIEVCCSDGLSWVEDSYCTSRSNNQYTNGWVVDFTSEKCSKSCE